jgi:hypothetical protein
LEIQILYSDGNTRNARKRRDYPGNDKSSRVRAQNAKSGAWKRGVAGCFKSEVQIIYAKDFRPLVGFRCLFQAFDRYFTEHDRLAMASKTEMPGTTVLAG